MSPVAPFRLLVLGRPLAPRPLKPGVGFLVFCLPRTKANKRAPLSPSGLGVSPAAAPLFQLTEASARLLISGSSGRRDSGRAGRKGSPVASPRRALPRRVLPGTPHPRREMALFKGLPGRSPPPPPLSSQPLFPLFLCAMGKRLRAAFRLNRQASLGRKSWKLLQASHFLSSALPAPINSKKAFVFLFAPINYSRDWHREGRGGEAHK